MFTSTNRRVSPSSDLASYSLSYTANSTNNTTSLPPFSASFAFPISGPATTSVPEHQNILPPIKLHKPPLTTPTAKEDAASKPSAFDLLISTAAYQWDLLHSKDASTPTSVVTPGNTTTVIENKFLTPPFPRTTEVPIETQPQVPLNTVLYSYSYQVNPALSAPGSGASNASSLNSTVSSSNQVTVTKTTIPRKRSFSQVQQHPQPVAPKKSPKLEISNLVTSSEVRGVQAESPSADYSDNNSSDSSSSDSPSDVSSHSASSSRKPPSVLKLCSPSLNAGRQRSGPSCDCCRSRKVKCDAEMIILSEGSEGEIPENAQRLPDQSSPIADCEYLFHKDGYQYFKIIHILSNTSKYTNSSYSFLKFKPCKACNHKSLTCCFSKGITRNDIARYNKVEKGKKSSKSPPPNQLSSPKSPLQPSQSDSDSSPSGSPKWESSGSYTIKSEKNDSGPTVLQFELPQKKPRVANSTNNNCSTASNSSKSGTIFVNPTEVQMFLPNYRRSSCSSCRSKKIKCFKSETGSSSCSHCTKKGLDCIY